MNKKQRLKQIHEIKEFNEQWIKYFMPMLEIKETPLLTLFNCKYNKKGNLVKTNQERS